ncbi:MAG TPA: SDR family NAD(P)-dependent oxidoreductase [Chloroflexota bacterium]|nr:SDR family NAD(P)-dependent oxidoreductase [Gemmataceae bacterium]HZU06161.1 SDR family NAD(P)-dependent oxidoreductase [Chloroflexota bacterium]
MRNAADAPQRYLVTGAAGFIGAQVAAQLLAAGHTVVGVDNLNAAYDVRLKEWRLAQLRAHPGFTFHRLDIADRATLHQLFAAAARPGAPPFAAVVNLAARAGVRPSVADPAPYFATNVTGTLHLLELCRAFGVPKFVLASTSSLYGAHTPRPFREDAATDRPLSPYAASKKAAEVLCYTAHHLHGLDVTVLRYFTVYGPAARPDMALFRFVQRISEARPIVLYGDGTQERDFTYIDDIARGTVLALRPLGYEIINLGSDRPVRLLDAIRTIEALVGQPARIEHRPRHPADAPATWADIGKAARLLGWRPTTPFAAGVAQLVAWYQQHRAWARHISTDE